MIHLQKAVPSNPSQIRSTNWVTSIKIYEPVEDNLIQTKIGFSTMKEGIENKYGCWILLSEIKRGQWILNALVLT